MKMNDRDRTTNTPRTTARRGLLATLAAGLLLAAGAALLGPASAASPEVAPARFSFDSLNRAYHLEDSDVAPVRQGPVTIHMSSPRNSLILKDHSVTLTPQADGTYQASVGIDLLGSGDLVADLVTDAGTSSRLEDVVIVPRQQVRLDGRVRFARVPDGWDVTALSLPREVELDIQSRLAGNLVTLCGQMAVFLGLDCDGLDRSLSRVGVPLPEAGSVFFLPEEDLSPAEVAALDAYLGFR
jgi:hypothetical protein